MESTLHRLVKWTLICTISAIPSFVWGQFEYDRTAMVIGLLMFITAYTAVSGTARFVRFERLPFIRRTLLVAYGTRMVCSIVFPVGMALDLLPGMISVWCVEGMVGTAASHGFGPTLAITLVQGILLNCLLGLYAGFIYHSAALL